MAAGCLARHALFRPLIARLTAPLLRQRPFRSLLGSERLALAKVKRLAAHDLFSLKPGAADQTLSVNALAKMIAQGRQRTRSIQRLRAPFSRPPHNMPGAATAAARNPSAVRPKVPQMNKSDSILHKKSSSSGAAVFPAAETNQNGKKVGICAIVGSTADFSGSRNARAGTMNVVHCARRRRFCPASLYARQN